jgi:hypothetical protein
MFGGVFNKWLNYHGRNIGFILFDISICPYGIFKLIGITQLLYLEIIIQVVCFLLYGIHFLVRTFQYLSHYFGIFRKIAGDFRIFIFL